MISVPLGASRVVSPGAAIGARLYRALGKTLNLRLPRMPLDTLAADLTLLRLATVGLLVTP